MKFLSLALAIPITVAPLTAQSAMQSRPVQNKQEQPVPKPSSPTNDSAALPETRSPDRAKRQLLMRVADVLRPIAGSAKDWTNAPAAVKVQSQVADLIWDVDAGAAHGYLIQAWDRAAAVKEQKSEHSRFRNSSARTSARQEVMLVARKRAPELAKKWLDQLAQEVETEQSNQARGVFDDRTARSTVLLQLAMQAVADNPQAAADLAVESLQDGISFGLQNVLIAIQEKDAGLAQKVFRAALARLKSVGAADPNELLILNAYLYTPGKVVGANTTENRSSFTLAVSQNQPRVTSAANLNPALALEFLQVAAALLINAPLPSATANSQETARAQISVIGSLMGKLLQQAPEQAAALQIKVQQIERDAHFSSSPQSLPADVPAPKAGESKAEYAERRIDVLEEIARKETDSLARDIAYAKAALATTAESYDRGRSLAGNIQDKTLNGDVKNWLTYQATVYFINSDDFYKAHELSARNDDLAQRAASLVIGAQKLAKKDKLRAVDWLQEARSLASKADNPDENWARIAFGIVSTYAQFDDLTALQTLAEAIKLADGVNVATFSDEKAPAVKRFSGLTFSDFTGGTKGFGWESAIAAFKPNQFENVLSALGRVSQPEARGLAIVALCRKYLQKNPIQKNPNLKPA